MVRSTFRVPLSAVRRHRATRHSIGIPASHRTLARDRRRNKREWHGAIRRLFVGKIASTRERNGGYSPRRYLQWPPRASASNGHEWPVCCRRPLSRVATTELPPSHHWNE